MFTVRHPRLGDGVGVSVGWRWRAHLMKGWVMRQHQTLAYPQEKKNIDKKLIFSEKKTTTNKKKT